MRNYLKTELNDLGQTVGQKLQSTQPVQYEATVLEGDAVRLLPLNPTVLNEQNIQTLWAAVCAEPDPSCWTYLPYDAFLSKAELTQTLAQHFNFLGSVHYLVEVNGECCGWIALLNIRKDSQALEIGNVYFSQKMKRSRASTEVLYLLLQSCFQQGFRRVEWKCDNLNEPSKRAALRFGFQYEGLFRQDRISKGRNRNTAWFSMLDDEWRILQTAYQSWLKPDNFDENGLQKSTLDAFAAQLISTL